MAEKDLKILLGNILRTHEKDDGLVITGVEVKDCSNPGDGFMSEVAAVDVVGRRGSGVAYSNNIFIKRQPSNEKRAELFLTSSAFSNEALAYCEVLPLMTVGREVFPNCYYAGEDYILLENLRLLGYKMADRSKGVDLAHAALAMKAIATYHAFTFQMRLQNEEQFSSISSKSFNLFVSDNSIFDQSSEQSLERGLNHLKLIPDPSIASSITKLQSLKGKVVQTLTEIGKSDFTVLSHGDFWMNNVMFRYDENDVVKDIKIIDLQGLSPASPAVDVWKFLYTSITPDLLDEHCEHLVTLYSASFRATLAKLEVPEAKIPDQETLRNEILSRELYGFLVALLYLPVVFMDFSNIPVDMDQMLADPDALKAVFNIIIVGFGERLTVLLKRCQRRNVL